MSIAVRAYGDPMPMASARSSLILFFQKPVLSSWPISQSVPPGGLVAKNGTTTNQYDGNLRPQPGATSGVR